jgi:two-component system sensor histidine kinase SenX3
MSIVAAVIGIVGLLFGLACLVLLVVRVRASERVLLRSVHRLGDTAPLRAGLPAALSRLERAVELVRQHDDATGESAERLLGALEQMTQGAVVCDANGQIVMRNRFARLFAEGRHGEVLVDSAVRDLLSQARAGLAADREVELFGPPLRLLYVHASPLRNDAGNAILGAIALIDDITEQHRIDAVRRDFVANISHELKTPVGAMALLSETLADEEDVAIVRRLADRIREESFRLSRIIDDLLALSRIEGTGMIEPALVSAATVIGEAVDRVRPAAEQFGITISVADIESSVALVADRRQLVSALVNLLENAVKYSDRGSRVEVRAAGNEHDVSLVVQDHGIGIPTRDLDRIFERFYRVDQARSRATGGTGLGLSIVRHVARNHGGDVKVSSREGEGSTFMLVLPSGLPAPEKASRES